MIAALKELGLRQPDFWYVPGIRKQTQENRGYAFIGFAGPTRRAEAQRLSELFCKPGFCPWPLRLEWSTANIKSMVNSAWLWRSNPIARSTLDGETTPPQAATPHHLDLDPWQCMLLKASAAARQLEIEAPHYAPPRYSPDWQLQDDQQPVPRYATSANPAYVRDMACKMDFMDFGINVKEASRHRDLPFPLLEGVYLSL